MDVPDPRYLTTADGAQIAYQVVGHGPVDIAWQFDFVGNIDMTWESPSEGAWMQELASFSRLILHDRRGTGLSSRNVDLGNLETRAADLTAVLGAVGSDSTVLAGLGESMAPCILLAASEPSRVRNMVWWQPQPRTIWSPDYPWGFGPEAVAAEMASYEHWGMIEFAEAWADQIADEYGMRPPAEEVRALARQSRNTCTADVIREHFRIWSETDVRAVLPTVQTATLLLADQEAGGRAERAELVCSLMPNATLVTIPATEWPSGYQALRDFHRPRIAAIQRFIGIEPSRTVPDTILSTVLFTDIVGSTEHQSRLGDREWKRLVEMHHASVRDALTRWRGVENDTAGDGFYATFDGPARAIHCASEVRDLVRTLGIEIRAGVHTGECELVDGKCAGIAVSTGARISALAKPSQVLISQTVKDLVAGSGFAFEPAGEHDLKGVPDRWRLYAVV